MIHRGCVKGFIFPDRQECVVAAVAEEGNGYFCVNCGRPLTGLQRKYCSGACESKLYYEGHKDKWKVYKSRQRARALATRR